MARDDNYSAATERQALLSHSNGGSGGGGTPRRIKSAKWILALNTGANFVFYGMDAILSTYADKHLGFGESAAKSITSAAIFLNFFSAVPGGYLADTRLGHFKNIVLGCSIMLAAVALLVVASALGEYAGISIGLHRGLLLAGVFVFCFGNGMLKPSASAFVGDQFHEDEAEQRSQYFGWYYLAVQVGSIASSIGMPLVLQYVGGAAVFGIMSGMMVLTIPVFLLGSRSYNKVPPNGKVFANFVRVLGAAWRRRRDKPAGSHALDGAKLECSAGDVEDVKTVMKVCAVFIPIILFWAVFFNMYTLWNFCAKNMDRRLGSFTLPAGNAVALNGIFDILLIPTFEKGLYPLVERCRGKPFTPLQRVGWGHVASILALVCAGLTQYYVDRDPGTVSILWIIPQYFWISVSEVLLSVSLYEFAYSQAPSALKGMVTSAWLLCIAMGNALDIALGQIQGHLAVQNFAMAGAMFLIMLVFILMTRNYEYATHAVVDTTEDSVVGDGDAEGRRPSAAAKHSINNQ